MNNKAFLHGRLGKDPEVKIVNEKKVAQFSLATDEGFGDKKTTQWHNVVVWEKVADVAEKYLKKGSEVNIWGKISYREYEKDGVKRTITNIVGYELTMIGGAKQTDSSPQATPASKAQQPVDDTDDLPF